MDAFNYLSVMVSIVLGLGLTQLFAGIGNLVQIRRRVKLFIPELLEGRIDVQRHYFDTSRVFFGILTATAAWAMFIEPIMGLRSFFVPFRFMQVAGVVAFGSCSASKNKRVHAAAIILIVLLLVTGIAFTRFRLGQFDIR